MDGVCEDGSPTEGVLCGTAVMSKPFILHNIVYCL